MKLWLTADEIHTYVTNSTDPKIRIQALREVCGMEDNQPLTELSLGTLMGAVERLSKQFTTTFHKNKWEIDALCQDYHPIKGVYPELIDGVWEAVQYMCEATIASHRQKGPFQRMADTFSKRFSYSVDRALGQLSVPIDGGKLIVQERNVNAHKFLFFFVEDYHHFWENKNNEAMVSFFIQQFLQKTKDEKMKSLILHYENLNNSILPNASTLDRLGFQSYHQTGLDYGSVFLFVNEAPDMFHQHLPRGFYLAEFEKDEQVSFVLETIQHIIDKIEPGADLYSLEEGLQLTVHDRMFHLRFRYKNNQLDIKVDEQVDYRYTTFMEISVAVNDNPSSRKRKLTKLVRELKK